MKVTITEVDTAAVSIDPTALTVAEGDSGSYSVVLGSEPTAEVTVTVGGHDGTDVSVSDATLTFTARRLGCGPDGDGHRGPGPRRGNR